MVQSHFTAHFVPKYRQDIRLRSSSGYSAEGQDSPEYIPVHRVERLAVIHIGCQQPSAEIMQTFGEDTECQDAIYGRLLGC